MTLKENLFQGRILSIDALRGITIFTMVFVNELAAISDVPGWMKHVAPGVDGMTFVDVVFPGFLFIVGMSIPFAFNARLRKKDTSANIWKHTLQRTIALMIMGLFMVNIEYGYDASKMLIPAAVWGLLAYTVPIIVWNQYPKQWSPGTRWGFRIGGLLIFLMLYFFYIQEDGTRGMTVKWWGILGLIGWAYLYSVLAYWFGKGKLGLMLAFLAVCITLNSLNAAGDTSGWLGGLWGYVGGHFSHTSIVMCGVIVSLLYYDREKVGANRWFAVFVASLFVIGYLLRPYFGVSKVGATPSWCLYSAGICAILYAILYIIIEERKRVKWTGFFMPSANDPLLIYILPGIVIYLCLSLGIRYRPEFLSSGLLGILWSLVFSVIMLYLVKLLNRLGVKLKL